MTVVDARQALPEDDYLLAMQQRRAEELAASGQLAEMALDEDALEELPQLEGGGVGDGGEAVRRPRRVQQPRGGGGRSRPDGDGGPEGAEGAKQAKKARKEEKKAKAIAAAAEAAAAG